MSSAPWASEKVTFMYLAGLTRSSLAYGQSNRNQEGAACSGNRRYGVQKALYFLDEKVAIIKPGSVRSRRQYLVCIETRLADEYHATIPFASKGRGLHSDA